MSTEENKAVVRRFAEAYNGRDAAVLNEVLTPDAAQRYLEIYIPRNSATWADERLDITDALAEGDRVWARVTHSAATWGSTGASLRQARRKPTPAVSSAVSPPARSSSTRPCGTSWAS